VASLLVLFLFSPAADVTDFFAKDYFGGAAVFFGGFFLAGADFFRPAVFITSFALVFFRVRAADFWRWVCLGISVVLTYYLKQPLADVSCQLYSTYSCACA